MYRSFEARKETLQMLDVYDELGKELLAVPFVKGQKTEKEKFAGAINTYTIEALMHDGKALQSGTTHYFGQGFAEAFGVKYLDKDGKINLKEMNKQAYTIDDLITQARSKGIMDLNEIRLAILESDGELSVYEKNEYKKYYKDKMVQKVYESISGSSTSRIRLRNKMAVQTLPVISAPVSIFPLRKVMMPSFSMAPSSRDRALRFTPR